MIAVTCLVLVLGQASPEATPPAPAGEVQVEKTPDGLRFMSLRDGQPVEVGRLDLGPVSDMLRHGPALYAALANGGLAVVDVSNRSAPVITTKVLLGKRIVQLGHRADVLTAVLDDKSVIELSTDDPLHPSPAEASSEGSGQASGPAASQPVFNPFGGQGTVTAVHDSLVVIQGGKAQGFRQGEHVRIVTYGSAQDQVAREAGFTPVGNKVAVVALDRVEEDRSMAHLGRGDSAHPGDVVTGTNEDLSESFIATHWVPFNWRLGIELRPFLDTNNTGSHAVGFLTDLMIAYYLPGLPLRAEIGLTPLGLAAGSPVQHNPVQGVLDLAFTSPYFEFGLGAGFAVQSTNQSCTPLDGSCPGSEIDSLIVEVLRIGALDGLDLTWRSSIASTPSGFVFNAGRGDVNIPLGTRLTLFFDASAGRGFASGDVGVRAYVLGLGGPGTLIFSAGLGGAAIFDNDETLSGPSVMLGLEARL